jgi:hypothetical protein
LISDLENMLEWAEDARQASGREVYELSKKYGADRRFDDNKLISSSLLLMAATVKNYPDAMFDFAMNDFNDPSTKLFGMSTGFLRTLGHQGDERALRELVPRHMDGLNIEQSNAAAYYWLLRSREFGLPDVSQAAELEARLTSSDRKNARKWLRRGKFPRDWEYRNK